MSKLALVLIGFLGIAQTSLAQDCFDAEIVQEQFNQQTSFATGVATGLTRPGSSLRTNIMVGFTFMGETDGVNQGSVLGPFAYGAIEPNPVNTFFASEGDYPDQIVINWTEEFIGAKVEQFKLFRNGSLLAEFPNTTLEYVDQNVVAGRFYQYSVIASNTKGDSSPREVIGFVNPNGTVTGKIKTINGRPILGSNVTLFPTLGTSMKFDGENDAIKFPQNVALNVTSATIEFWIRPDGDASGFTPIVIKEANGEATRNFAVGLLDGTKTLTVSYHNGTSLQLLNGKVNLENRKWQHVAASISDGKMYLYIDGTLESSGDFSGTPVSSSAPVFVGAVPGVYGKFKGELDDIRIWNVERDLLRVREYMKRSLNSSNENDGLVAYWKLDEGTGDKVFDVTSNDIDGTRCGPAYIEEIPEVLSTGTTDVEGNYVIEAVNYGNGTTFSAIPTKITQTGRSVSFDGMNDYADVGDDILLEDSFSIEFWARRDVSGRDQILFSQGNSQSAGTSLQIGFNAENKIYFSFSNADLVSSNEINDLWHHIAVVYNAETRARVVYVDGQIAASDISDIDYSGSGAVHVGKASFAQSNFFDGSLDELRVWTDARSQSEIQESFRGELGNNREDLIAYVQFNEGSDFFSQDITGFGNGVEILNGDSDAIWSADIPFADDFIHTFEPESRKLTLNNSNTSVDNIDFDDLSLLAVTGYVRYNGTDCFADSVEILVNGNPVVPPVITDETGKFVVELEPGSSVRLSPRFEDHSFLPANYEVVNITQPVANVVFENMENRTLQGVVAGGECLLPIGVSNVTIRSLSGCFEREVSTDDTGRFTAENLPPLQMAVIVNHPDPNITNALPGQEVSLVVSDNVVEFKYRADPILDLTFLDSITKGDKTVFTQNQRFNVQVQMRERYINNTDTAFCPVDTATVVIRNFLAFEIDDTVQVVDGSAVYSFVAGEPNITGDYLLSINATATDRRERTAVNNGLSGIVEGTRPRETTFTTRTPDVPFMILHDPPGDASYAYIESGVATSSSISMAVDKGTESSTYVNASLGPDWTIDKGIGVSVGSEFEVIADFERNVSVTKRSSSLREQTFSFTTNERISTSSSDAFVSEEGDLYVGGALNLVYGNSDVLSVADDGVVTISQDIIFVPEEFATTFIYSESFIVESLIPSLFSIQDTISANAWMSYVQQNRDRKNNAPFVRNLSFDAGAQFEYSETTQTTTFTSIETFIGYDEEFTTRAGMRVQDVGVETGVAVSTRINIGASVSGEVSNSQTFGFVLADTDQGDFFSVDIRTDPVYGSPVFGLVSGSSSNPWQPGTSRRDRPFITLNPINTVEVAPTEVASFRANLANDNLDERRLYTLSVNQQTNSNGAAIFINGVPVEEGIAFALPAGAARNVEITASKGANAYEYQGIEMRFAAALDTSIYDTGTLDFSFYEPCSEINIAEPQNGFVVTSNDPDTVLITLFDYENEGANIRDVQVQYRRSVTTLKTAEIEDPSISSNEWITIASIPADELGDNFTNVRWATTELLDGPYQIRSILTCTDDPIANSSGIISGLIDRSAPRVNGLPSPVSGVLGPDDQITVTFSEDIDNSFINPLGDVLLFNSETGQPIDIDVVVFNNGVTITPTIQDEFLENRTLRASVTGISDLVGNELRNPVVWEFLYNKSPVRWERPVLQSNSLIDEKAVIEAEFKNTGGSPITFQITNIPSWASVSPISATVSPGAEEIVRISLNQLGAGFYETLMIAETSQGEKPLRIRHRVLCEGPGWILDESKFQLSMNILGELKIGDVVSTDEFDRIGAFINGELRGVGKVEYVPSIEKYQVFLTVYSNRASGEEILFQVWDASSCLILDGIQESIFFEVNELVGAPLEPFPFDAKEQIIQSRETNSGWTWISFNANPIDPSVQSVLQSLSLTDTDMIRGQTSFSQFTPGIGWIGTLNAVETGSMYQIRTNEPSELSIQGAPLELELDTIAVSQGWNWIGYSPTFTLPINQALNSLQPLDGDIIKSQTRFSVYVAGSGWVGNLGTLRPMEGYALYSNAGGFINFPTAPIGALLAKNARDRDLAPNLTNETDQIPPIEEWEYEPADFEHSMSLIATVDSNATLGSIDSTIYVGAFVNGEVRGVEPLARYDSLDYPLAFLTIYSNQASGEIIIFYLYDSDEDQMYFSGRKVVFESNGVIGDVKNPIVMNPTLTSNEREGYGLPQQFELFQNYPNPFNGTTIIKFALPEASEVTLDIYNVLGQRIQTLISGNQLQAGFHSYNWNLPENYATGMYFYRLRAGDFQAIQKMMYIK